MTSGDDPTMPTWWRVCHLSIAGVDVAEQASVLGVSKKSILEYASKARRLHGKNVRVPGVKVYNARTDRKIPAAGGGMDDLLRRLPNDTLNWLIRETPKGGAIIDLIVAVVLDAHYEDTLVNPRR